MVEEEYLCCEVLTCLQVGAGLQLTPNATRLLVRWGLKSGLEKLASSPQEFLVRRYDGRKRLGERQNFASEMLEKYGSYYWDMHRADLQLAMFERAKNLGVRFQFGTLVTDVNSKIPQLTTDKGEKITGDLVIAADGESAPHCFSHSIIDRYQTKS